MQSVLSPHLAFVTTDPHLYVPDYKLKLLEEDKKKVDLELDEPFLTRSIVTIPENYTEMTANLVAPLVINSKKGIGKQFVLTSMEYDTRHYLLPEEMRTPPATPPLAPGVRPMSKNPLNEAKSLLAGKIHYLFPAEVLRQRDAGSRLQ